MKKTIPRRQRGTRKKKLGTQQAVLKLAKSLKPRYLIRASTRDKQAAPFLYEVGKDIPSNAIRMTESVFDKLVTSGKIKRIRSVNNSTYGYNEYIYSSPRRIKT